MNSETLHRPQEVTISSRSIPSLFATPFKFIALLAANRSYFKFDRYDISLNLNRTVSLFNYALYSFITAA